jgi:hypothetical protein
MRLHRKEAWKGDVVASDIFIEDIGDEIQCWEYLVRGAKPPSGLPMRIPVRAVLAEDQKEIEVLEYGRKTHNVLAKYSIVWRESMWKY